MSSSATTATGQDDFDYHELEILQVHLSARGSHSRGEEPAANAKHYFDSYEVPQCLACLIYREQVKRLDVSQVKKLVPVSVTTSLSKFKKTFQLVCLGGQTKNFPEEFSSGKENIPILPYGTMAKLVVKY